MWHGLPARDNTAKMAVPTKNQQRLNTYSATADKGVARGQAADAWGGLKIALDCVFDCK